MNCERNGDPENRERICEDRFPFKAEKQHEGGEERGDRHRRQNVEEFFLEPLGAFDLHDPAAREVTGDERQRDVDSNRKQQGLPGDRHPIHSEEPASEDAVEQQHGEGVDRHHDESEPLVTAGEISPDQDHCGAGSNPEQNRAGDIRAIELHFRAAFDHFSAGEEIFEKVPEKKGRDSQHGEGLDRPVHDQSQENRPGTAACLDHFAKVDLHHDWIHHEKEANGDGDGNHRGVIHVDRHPVERLREVGCEFAESNAGDNTKRDPGGKVALKKAHGRFVETHGEKRIGIDFESGRSAIERSQHV